MITGAAICPAAPLLARELTGRDPVIPGLRQACAAAVARLVRSGPEVIAVVGPARRTATWPADGRLRLASFAPALGIPGPAAPALGGPEPGAPALGVPEPLQALPLPLGLGARLLDEGGYRGRRLLRSVGADEPAQACLRLGADLHEPGGRVGLLVMADGSACRTVRAPGYLDARAAPFDAVLEQAVRSGDLGALRDMDESLARELLASGRAAWQVLAGAMPGRGTAAEVFYSDAPFGVFYLVAWLARSAPGPG